MVYSGKRHHILRVDVLIHSLEFLIDGRFEPNSYRLNSCPTHSRKQLSISSFVQPYLSGYVQPSAYSSLVISKHIAEPYCFVPLLTEKVVNHEEEDSAKSDSA